MVTTCRGWCTEHQRCVNYLDKGVYKCVTWLCECDIWSVLYHYKLSPFKKLCEKEILTFLQLSGLLAPPAGEKWEQRNQTSFLFLTISQHKLGLNHHL